MSDVDTSPAPSQMQTLDWSSGKPLGVSNQGEVKRFELNGHPLAIKATKGWGLLRHLRQKNLGREFQAYQRLDGIAGFPRCHGLINDAWLVLDFVPGQSIRDAAIENRAEFFDCLLRTIQQMHEAGVAHGDLKRKSNILVDQRQQPVIIDLGTAVLRPERPFPLRQRLFDFVRQTDLNAWVKLKYGGYEGVSTADRQYLRRSRIEQWLSRLR